MRAQQPSEALEQPLAGVMQPELIEGIVQALGEGQAVQLRALQDQMSELRTAIMSQQLPVEHTSEEEQADSLHTEPTESAEPAECAEQSEERRQPAKVAAVRVRHGPVKGFQAHIARQSAARYRNMHDVPTGQMALRHSFSRIYC